MSTSAPAEMLTEIVSAKLKKMLGEVKGTSLLGEIFAKIGKHNVDTPDDLKRVADELISRGGLTKMIGHSIMTEALLRGARA